jgi:hypothetical protein
LIPAAIMIAACMPRCGKISMAHTRHAVQRQAC